MKQEKDGKLPRLIGPAREGGDLGSGARRPLRANRGAMKGIERVHKGCGPPGAGG